MTPDRTDANPDENAEHGVLDESGNLDTASITILGGHIAQVNVDLPMAADDDVDDDVIEDEIPIDAADLPLLDAPYERRPDGAQHEIAHAHHVETLPTGDIILEPHDDTPHGDDSSNGEHASGDVHDAELVDEGDADIPSTGFESSPADADGRTASEPAAEAPADHGQSVWSEPEEHDAGEASGNGDVGHAVAAQTDDGASDAGGMDVRADDLHDADIVDDVELFEADAVDPGDIDVMSKDEAPADAAEPVDGDVTDADEVPADATEPLDGDVSGKSPADGGFTDRERTDAAETADGAALTHAPWVPATVPAVADVRPADERAAANASVDSGERERDDDVADAHLTNAVEDEPVTDQTEDDVASPQENDTAGAVSSDRNPARSSGEAEPATAPVAAVTPVTGSVPPAAPGTGAVPTGAPATGSAPVTAPAAGPASGSGSAPAADSPAPTGPVPATRAERAATGAIGTVPLTRRGAHQADEAARAADEAARVDRAHAMERVRTPAAEVTLTSKRIGQIDDARESSDLLTADRLLDPRQIAKPEPEGLWQQLVYSMSGHRINLGDGRKARERKDLDRRIAAPLAGGARFVPVLSRKGGVGKTTVTSLLGMALADARDDRIIAVDANPDRGTLADRAGRPNGRTVRDLVRAHEEVAGYNDVSSIVARDATRLDVLASDADPRVSEAFSDDDYRRVADVAAHYYSIVLTDTGTGIVHSVMGATLELADTIVIVAGLSVDEARLASETLTWLETNGYAARVRDAVVVLNNSRPGAPLVRESELEAHFRSRVRTVIRMPYDARIAAGSAIAFRDLQPSTRQAARELAAAVVEGLRSPVAAA
ncbi:MinD/ParA family protein [Microbacterium enclense]|uniref:MinD-like ATPase involved in chromosome partitioning or flagellar assembly n=1 Tax=Microbacterium enclense TaxID=993073 RepID=A0A1G6L2R1_9MICO|nr:MinD/ParA family protein [Microbacterium enclense]SDC37669.1 MinD-like ATPase involved in chromosome partitioning or flagellar assembly [Microbacterium enclense]